MDNDAHSSAGEVHVRAASARGEGDLGVVRAEDALDHRAMCMRGQQQHETGQPRHGSGFLLRGSTSVRRATHDGKRLQAARLQIAVILWAVYFRFLHVRTDLLGESQDAPQRL